MPCNCCEMENNTFGAERAKMDIREYRRRGPASQTRLILEAIRSLGLKGVALLDIGGGVGTIHHELLDEVASEATHVDASSAYLKEAQEEAQRRAHTEHIRFIHADFTDVAGDLPQADIVTLDRVVCCYPEFRRLLKAAAEHGRRAVALTYPREIWYMRIGLGCANFLQRLRKDPFRIFIHPVAEMEALFKAEGFRKTSIRRLFIWEMALYQREMI